MGGTCFDSGSIGIGLGRGGLQRSAARLERARLEKIQGLCKL